MKKFLKLFLLIFATEFLFAQENVFNQNQYEEYTLENGIKIFVLEDFSSATIRIEYSVKAGFSSQTQANTGFFSLYTRLFQKSSKNFNELKKLHAECNADSSRYIISTSPSKVERTLTLLASQAFSPAFSDKLIKEELSALKTEVMQYAYTPAAFINASIDSRVFSSSPWKHDSGIYPALFSKTSPAQARTILSAISNGWYIPQNTAIFISGCIKKEAALNLIKRTFGQYEAALSVQRSNGLAAGNKVHKFVLYDNDFSEDLTQIIVQYASLSMNQADIIASCLNSNFSTLKTNLIENPGINIREKEYINAAAAHKNGTSRLIIQALLEKNKYSITDQCENFVKETRDSIKMTREEEFTSAKNRIISSFNKISSDSETFMEYLSNFWALSNADSIENQISLSQKMMKRPQEINAENNKEILNQLEKEDAFVFVLVNTKNFKKCKNLFAKAGYESVNRKNGSWYLQKLQQNASQNLVQEKALPYLSDFDSEDALKSFIEESKKSLSYDKLQNGIPVTFKENKNTSQIAILIAVKGGKFSDQGKAGFESLMINSFANNIQNELNQYSAQGILEGFPDVEAETLERQSFISIVCQKEDLTPCIKSIGNALIFSDIIPASADSAVYACQTQKRIFNANPVNQIIFRGIKYLYDDYLIRDIYDSDKDILQRTTYTEILASYPKLLNADRYSIYITGNFDKEKSLENLNSSLGLLSTQKKLDLDKEFQKADFPEKAKRVSCKIRHLFYTDVKAEDAGPMPAVLVPTKDFSDPLLFLMKCPDDHYERLLYNALLINFLELINERADAKLFLPESELPISGITFLNVSHTEEIENLYLSLYKEFTEGLNNEDEIENIKSSWIMHYLSQSKSNLGTAKLLAKGEKADEYLEDYTYILEAKPEDFRKIAEEYLLETPLLKVYSSDAKK
ncbi:MAG: hypothetical protein K6F15_03300 [Treponema sp.]|nr:hypothetical protein [Treponema sp.]